MKITKMYKKFINESKIEYILYYILLVTYNNQIKIEQLIIVIL